MRGESKVNYKSYSSEDPSVLHLPLGHANILDVQRYQIVHTGRQCQIEYTICLISVLHGL